MPVTDIPDADLLRRVLRGLRNTHAGRPQRWVVVSEVFGLGSTYSRELCRLFDLDPDEVLPRGRLIRES
jgi:hypothetical protein